MILFRCYHLKYIILRRKDRLLLKLLKLSMGKYSPAVLFKSLHANTDLERCNIPRNEGAFVRRILQPFVKLSRWNVVLRYWRQVDFTYQNVLRVNTYNTFFPNRANTIMEYIARSSAVYMEVTSSRRSITHCLPQTTVHRNLSPSFEPSV